MASPGKSVIHVRYLRARWKNGRLVATHKNITRVVSQRKQIEQRLSDDVMAESHMKVFWAMRRPMWLWRGVCQIDNSIEPVYGWSFVEGVPPLLWATDLINGEKTLAARLCADLWFSRWAFNREGIPCPVSEWSSTEAARLLWNHLSVCVELPEKEKKHG